jgi:hypothetical protein
MAGILFYNATAETENLYFNGSTTEIEYTTATIAATTSVTIDAWIYPTAAQYGTIADCGTASGENYWLAIDANREVWIRWYNGGWSDHRWLGNTVTLNQWNHICGVIKPNVANGCKLYVNGSKAGEIQDNRSLKSGASERLKVGRDRDDVYQYQGYIKNLIITTNSDVSEAEILQHAAGNYSSVTSPDVYWKLDETEGAVAIDSSGNEYNGTISNGTWQIIS